MFSNKTVEDLISEALDTPETERELDLAMRLANALEEVEALTKELGQARGAAQG